MLILYLSYLFLILISTIILLRQADHKIIVGVLLVWLLGYPVLGRPEFIPTLEFIGIDLQPNRALLLLFGCFIILRQVDSTLWRRKADWQPWFGFEILLLLYIILVSTTIILNRNHIGSDSRAIALAVGPWAFFFTYTTVKNICNQRDYEVFSKAIIALSIFSTVISIVQFFIDPEFFRMGDTRLAFMNFSRANGVFSQEYDQGFFQITALMIWLAKKHSKVSSIIFYASSFISIFLTMHRLSWMIFFSVMVIYFILYAQRNPKAFFSSGITVLFLILIVLLLPWEDIIPNNIYTGFISGRLTDDTLTIRTDYYKLALSLIRKYPLGIGTYFTEFYNQEAYLAGVPFQFLSQYDTRALIIHNGLLSAGVKNGLLGIILFAALLLNLLFFSLKEVLQHRRQSPALFFVVLIFLLFNATNDFSDLGTQINILFAVVLGFCISETTRTKESNMVIPQ